jgi:hypothetical protein
MLTIILSILAGILATIAVSMGIKKKKSAPTPEPTFTATAKLEVIAMEKAEEMSRAEREDLLSKYGKTSTECTVVPGIVAQINHLNVQYITVHGVRYVSIVDAVNKAADLDDETAIRMLTLDKELYILRKEKFDAKRHYTVASSTLLGKVYVYNECTIAVDVKEGPWANKPARIAVKIGKTDGGYMTITDLYLAEGDISQATSYDHFNLRTANGKENFEKIIGNKDEEFYAEYEAIQEILARTNKHKYFVQKELLSKKNGNWVFEMPTKDQIAKIKELDDIQEGTEEDEELPENVVNIFEFMHSSQE